MKKIEPNPMKLRKPYEKPQIQRVSLAPEEAVLAGCKVLGWVGPGYNACINGLSEPCNVLSS